MSDAKKITDDLVAPIFRLPPKPNKHSRPHHSGRDGTKALRRKEEQGT